MNLNSFSSSIIIYRLGIIRQRLIEIIHTKFNLALHLAYDSSAALDPFCFDGQGVCQTERKGKSHGSRALCKTKPCVVFVEAG